MTSDRAAYYGALVLSAGAIVLLALRTVVGHFVTLPDTLTGAWVFFDLTRLPKSVQESLVFVFFMPLGGLITAAFRAFLQIKTLGYFTATLIAVSFVHSEWRSGLAFFVVITTIGLAGRFFVERLQLTKRARLSLVLLLLAVAISACLSVLHHYQIEFKSRGVMLPTVALAWMIEHVHAEIEKVGSRSAAKRVAATLLIAGSMLVIFRMAAVQRAFLRFPEIELLVAAVLILVGRYRLPTTPEAAIDASEKDSA